MGLSRSQSLSFPRENRKNAPRVHTALHENQRYGITEVLAVLKRNPSPPITPLTASGPSFCAPAASQRGSSFRAGYELPYLAPYDKKRLDDVRKLLNVLSSLPITHTEGWDHGQTGRRLTPSRACGTEREGSTSVCPHTLCPPMITGSHKSREAGKGMSPPPVTSPQ